MHRFPQKVPPNPTETFKNPLSFFCFHASEELKTASYWYGRGDSKEEEDEEEGLVNRNDRFYATSERNVVMERGRELCTRHRKLNQQFPVAVAILKV